MILNCESCSATLRADEKRFAGRTSARCPKCSARIELKRIADRDSITIVCDACNATLRAPSSRAGTRSRCPKCGNQVTVDHQRPVAAAPSAEDSSGVATRRIDSRSLGLGMMGSPENCPPAGDVDVDEFLGAGEGARTAAKSEAGEGFADAMLHPPTTPIRHAADAIREAAATMNAPAPAAPIEPGEEEKRPSESLPKEPPPVVAPVKTRTAARTTSPSATSERRSMRAAYPASRGLIAGSVAGLLVGAAWWFAEPFVGAAGFGWTIPVLQVPAQLAAYPEPAVRGVLIVLLGALAGFVAAAAGSPTKAQRPLRVLRCAAIGLLAGASTGMAMTLLSGTPPEEFSLWPTLNWVRDLLLVGLLTPALNRILPGTVR